MEFIRFIRFMEFIRIIRFLEFIMIERFINVMFCVGTTYAERFNFNKHGDAKHLHVCYFNYN